ncbi:MAG: methyltransferase [Roseomonas sp.]|nr:methyltransferase [Roseomonas sp.]
MMHDATTPYFGPVFWDATQLHAKLDRLVDLAWQPGWAPLALGELIHLCAWLRHGQGAGSWAEVQAALASHPLHRLMLEDPLIYHAAASPPVWLDLLLGHADAAPLTNDISRAGRDLFAATRDLAWPAALRGRTAFLARMVDAVAAEAPGASILTLGAGHLREAAGVTAASSLQRWSVIEPEYTARQTLLRGLPKGLAVQFLRCSLRGFARQPLGRGVFDLVCLPALSEGWDDATLNTLVGAAFQVLKPGGRLLICAPGKAPPEAAWMEAVLRCTPRWTGTGEMEALLEPVRASHCALRQVFPSVDGHMIYAILRRRG